MLCFEHGLSFSSDEHLVATISNVQNAFDCQDYCKDKSDCKFFSLNDDNHICKLYDDQYRIRERKGPQVGFISGPKTCPGLSGFTRNMNYEPKSLNSYLMKGDTDWVASASSMYTSLSGPSNVIDGVLPIENEFVLWWHSNTVDPREWIQVKLKTM